MKDLLEFEKKINYIFKNKKLLKEAFTHCSYLNEYNNKNINHNERLEFLGDAVLELAATKFLYNKFPKKTEGELTSIRSALVNTYSLSKKSSELELNNYILLAKGEKDSKKGRHHILANTFEAIIGAIFIDSGFEKAEDFLEKNLFDYVDEIIKNKLYNDPKSHFQELAQEHKKITPTYKLIKDKGPDHDKIFVLGLYLGKELIASGEGSSKQKAEVDAAKNALKKIKW